MTHQDGSVTYECFAEQVIPQGDPMSCSDKPQLPPFGLSWDDEWEIECVKGGVHCESGNDCPD